MSLTPNDPLLDRFRDQYAAYKATHAQLRLYALIDLTAMSGDWQYSLSNIINAMPRVPLYGQTGLDDLSATGPFLIACPEPEGIEPLQVYRSLLSLTRRDSRFVSWLWATHEVEPLVGHLQTLLHAQLGPDGDDAWFFFHQPAYLPVLHRTLPEETRRYMFGPCLAWWCMDYCGALVELPGESLRIPKAWEALPVPEDVVDALHRAGAPAQVRAWLQRARPDVLDNTVHANEQLQQLAPFVEQAFAYGLTGKVDQGVYAAAGLLYGRQYDEHPALQAVLTQFRNGKKALIDAYLFDTVESVGLPAHNLTDMRMHVPEQVERCLQFVASHELRACFPLTPVRGSDAFYEEIVIPGMHSDVGGGYRPGEQGRSDLLPRIALNRMRIEAAISGVPFIAPKLAENQIYDLFEYDEDVKALFDEYMHTAGSAGTLEQQIFAHMRLYYGWLKARFGKNPCDLYQGVCSTDPEINAQIDRIKQFHGRMNIDIDTMNWRAYLTRLWNSDRSEYERKVSTAGGDQAMNKPLTEEQLAYWDTWLNPPTLPPNLIRFFDQYVHDSRAGFLRIDSSGYLRPRQVIDAPPPVRATASKPGAMPVPVAQAAAAPQVAFSGS
jgi:hypothetical protein